MTKERKHLGPSPAELSERDGVFDSLKSTVVRRAVFPVMMRRFRPSARRRFKEIRSREFAAKEEIDRIQWSKLQTMVQYAAQHVPYYRNEFRETGIRPEDVRSLSDYARLPILTKSTVQHRLQELLSDDPNAKRGLPNASGGSTGKPVQFYQNAEYWDWACATQWFVESWWGIRPGDRTASLWGADRDIPDQSWKERLYGAIAQTRVCNAFALTGAQMEDFAKMLVTWKPRHVIGYASALGIFSQFLLERKEFCIRPRAVKTTADVLSDEGRALIEKAFGCPVYNFYGSREINNLAVECPARDGLHVNSQTRYIEIVDELGNPVPAGVPGRILLTDLTNKTMPFLRYEIEDIGTWKGQPCRCGRPFPLLERVWGRSSDFIVTPEGKLIHSVFFTHLFYDIPEVTLFQVNQKELTDVRVYLVLRSGTNAYPADMLDRRLREAFGPKVQFCVQVVPTIERPQSGKHRFTVSAVKASWQQSMQSPAEMKGVFVQ
jgi:phenylacetate-CoA ligase